MQRKPVDSIKVEMVAGHGGHIRCVPVNSSEFELEYLEIPAHPVTVCQPDAHKDTFVRIPASLDSPVPEIPHQPETPAEGCPPVAEPSQKPTWLRDYLRTVVCSTV